MVNRKHKRRGRVGVNKQAEVRAEEQEQEQAVADSSEDDVVEGTPATAQAIGRSTVRNYVSAIVDLWQKQQAVANGQIANPRAHPSVKHIMETLNRTEAQRIKGHHNNRRDGQYPISDDYIRSHSFHKRRDIAD